MADGLAPGLAPRRHSRAELSIEIHLKRRTSYSLVKKLRRHKFRQTVSTVCL